MQYEGQIKNANELEFAVFCIENTASKLGVNGKMFIKHWRKIAIFYMTI